MLCCVWRCRAHSTALLCRRRGWRQAVTSAEVPDSGQRSHSLPLCAPEAVGGSWSPLLVKATWPWPHPSPVPSLPFSPACLSPPAGCPTHAARDTSCVTVAATAMSAIQFRVHPPCTGQSWGRKGSSPVLLLPSRKLCCRAPHGQRSGATE